MHMFLNWRRRSRVMRMVPLILIPLVGGCSAILDTKQEYATNATIEVTGTSPVPLLLVSSTNWVYAVNQETGVQTAFPIEADTVSLQLPINLTVPLTSNLRIYFRLINPDLNQTASIRMRVRLDEKQVFDQAANMRDAALEYSYFYR